MLKKENTLKIPNVIRHTQEQQNIELFATCSRGFKSRFLGMDSNQGLLQQDHDEQPGRGKGSSKMMQGCDESEKAKETPNITGMICSSEARCKKSKSVG